MTLTIRVIDALYISNYKVLITFSDGKQQTVDFENFLKTNSHPQFAEYLDLKKFRKFKIERGNIVWGKDWDLIFPVEELHEGKIKS